MSQPVTYVELNSPDFGRFDEPGVDRQLGHVRS